VGVTWECGAYKIITVSILPVDPHSEQQMGRKKVRGLGALWWWIHLFVGNRRR